MLLITGATGTVGAHLHPLLAARGAAARLLTRDPQRLPGVAAPLEVVRGTVTQVESLRAALDGVDAMLLLSPPDPKIPDWEPAAIEAAREAGVGHIVKLSVGGTAPDSPLLLGRAHAASEQHLAASGIPHTLLKPAAFLQNLFGSLPTVKSDNTIYNAHGDGRSAPIDAADVAAVADACLADSAHAGKTYVLTGPRAVTFAEIAAALAETSGRAIQHVSVPTESYEQALVGAGLPTWLARDLSLLSHLVAEGAMTDVSPDVESVLGRPARSIQDFARQYGSLFA